MNTPLHDRSTRQRRVMLRAVVLSTAWMFAFGVCDAQDQRLIKQAPYDVIYLKDDPKPYRVLPLEGAKRRPIESLQAGSKLVVRMYKRPDSRYQVAAAKIDRIELFEQLVLKETAAFIQQARFDDAYANLNFIEQMSPDFPGSAETLARCLFAEAGHWQNQGQLTQALSLLNQLYDRDREFAGLSMRLGTVVQTLCQQYIEQRRFKSARTLLDQLKSQFPEHATVRGQQEVLQKLAREALESAKQARADDQLREAHERSREMMQLWPEVEGGEGFIVGLQKDYPLVTVGVRSANSSWAHHRRWSLEVPMLLQMSGYTGGVPSYRVSTGKLQLDGLTAAIDVSDARWSDGGKMQNIDVATSLRLQKPVHQAIDRVTSGDDGCRISFLGPADVWIGAADCVLQPWKGDRQFVQGPFQLAEQDDRRSRFVVDDKHWSFQAGQPREVVEVVYSAPLSAFQDLADGKIEMLDRVFPWELELARRYTEFQIKPYAATTICFLVVNPDKPQLRDLLLRKAICSGIHRQRIVREIRQQADENDLRATAGIFPAGRYEDRRLQPFAYQPRVMASVLGVDANQQRRELVLVHEESEISRRSATAIRTHLELDGAGPRIRAMEVNDPPSTLDWDLRLVEWYAMDPVVDIEGFFGAQGLSGEASIAMQRALSRLRQAGDRGAVDAAMTDIFRISHQELTVIPLWEVQEYYAVRPSLEGVGNKPVNVYQNIGRWR